MPVAMLSLFILSFIYSVILFFNPLVHRVTFDIALPASDEDVLLTVTYCYMMIGVLSLLSNSFIEIIATYIRAKLIIVIRSSAIQKLLRFRYSFFLKNQTGTTVQYIIPEIENIAFTIAQSIRAVAYILQIAILLTFVFVINRVVFLICCIVLFFFILWQSVLKRQLLKISGQLQIHNGRYFTFFFEFFTKIKLLKLYNVWDMKYKELNRISADFRNVSLRVAMLNSILLLSSKLVPIASLTVLIFCYGWLRDNKMTLGSYILLSTVTFLFIFPLTYVVNAFGKLQSGVVSANRLRDMIESNNEETSGNISLRTIRSGIEFCNVFFEYNENRGSKVLNNFCLSINKGFTVALVGRSGSGKSTIANLLIRLVDPTSGVIKIDGIPIQSYDIDSLRKTIGYFSQESFLFNDTIAANIDLYNEKSAEENASLLKRVGLDKFADNLEFSVGERGGRLSGGERQRVALARLLNHRYSVLILDEPTANLDPFTEAMVLKNIEMMKNDNPEMVVVIISHREMDIRNSDQVIVLDNGVIVEQGTQQQLIKNKGHYWEIFSEESVNENKDFEESVV